MDIDIKKLQQIMDEATESGEECGCELAIFQHGKPVVSLVSGYTSADRTEKVTERTMFPLFSCGKNVMATMVHRLVEQGIMDYEARVADYWPEFGCNGKEDIRLWHLLSHRSGLYQLPPMDHDRQADWDYMCKIIAQAVPAVKPGTASHYQSLSHAWLLGEPVRRATGRSMQQLIREQIFQPLGIDDDFAFGTTEDQDRRRARVDSEQDDWRMIVTESPAIRHGFIPSYNGYGSAFALAKYCSALVVPTDGIQLLKKSTVDKAIKLCRHPDDPIPDDINYWPKFGLGYALCGEPEFRGRFFGHGGALGSEGCSSQIGEFSLAFTKNKNLASHPVHPVRNRISAALGIPCRIW